MDDDYDDDRDDNLHSTEPPPMEQDNRQYQHIELIKKLRLQLRDLEKYAYERGELDQVPASVLAERQNVIIEAIKDKLSLNIDKDVIERLELDDLKKQIDKEIHELIDPLITKEFLLTQLKTQLTDLERYIAHLHGTMGKNSEKVDCSCRVHGCSFPATGDHNMNEASQSKSSILVSNDALPRTSRLIRSLIAQLICSDMKIHECAKKGQALEDKSSNGHLDQAVGSSNSQSDSAQFHDRAAWSLHIDRIILATDSLMNLFSAEPNYQRANDKPIDDSLVESVVRRQLVPAIKDLLSYGLIDPHTLPHSTSYTSFLFDPYYLLSSLTCFPSQPSSSNEPSFTNDKIHIWNVIEDYYKSRNETNFKNSSIKTLSQSFNLAPSISGPIKITSRQALLIAIDDIIETLSKCKPNGPDSHFRTFIYIALNRCKLSTWLRLIFKNKSIVRKYYLNFGFVSQPEKIDKFLATIETLSQVEFKLPTELESVDRFVSAF